MISFKITNLFKHYILMQYQSKKLQYHSHNLHICCRTTDSLAILKLCIPLCSHDISFYVFIN